MKKTLALILTFIIMAAALISLIPVGVLFLSMQRFFIEGVATSGLKG